MYFSNQSATIVQNTTVANATDMEEKTLASGFKSIFEKQDLTVGRPLPGIVKFLIPMLIGNIAQLLYGTVDSLVVGRYVGDAALSAVGISNNVVTLFIVFFMAIGSGMMIMVSQYFGAREYRNLEYTIGNGITIIAVFSILLTVLGLLLAAPILSILKTPEECFELSKTYLIIVFIGLLGDGFYNIMSGIIRGTGNSVFPLIILLGTTFLNIVLDVLFVKYLHMGIAGAAWATIIGKSISAVILVVKVLKMKGDFKVGAKHLKIRNGIVINMCRLGIPSGVSQAVIFFASIVIQRLYNSMGVSVVAATTIVSRVDAFAVIPVMTIGHAVSTFSGQNTGAGRLDRVKQGARASLILSLIITAVLLTVLLIVGKWALGCFTDTDEIIELGYKFILFLLPCYVFMDFTNIFGGIMRGAGDTVPMMWFSLIANVLLRIPLSYWIASMTVSDVFPAGNPSACYIAVDICLLVESGLATIYYLRGKWKEKAIVGKEN